MNGIRCSENKKLKYYYIIHLILYIIIIIFNFFLVNKVFWINNIFYYLYLYTTFSQIIYFIVPIISLIFILLKILTKKKIQYLKIANIVFCVLSIVVGLFFIVTLMINALESPDFYKECPFNLPTININQDQCLNKRCILNYNNSNNELLYEYFCNYNPTKDFEEEYNQNSSDYKIICESFAYNSYNNYIFENEIINIFLDVCNLMSDYYICQRYSEPKFYNIEKDFECPNDKYLKILILFSILNIIINLILGFIPWRIEIIIYDKILSRQLLQNNRDNLSINSTKNCSKVIKETGESSFKKNPTETIIVCNENNLQIQNNNNNNIDNNNNKNNTDNNNDNNVNNNKINIYISKITNIKNINNNEIIINSINKIENNNINNNPKNKEKKNNNKGNNIKERNLSINNNKFNLDLKKQIDKKGDKKGEKKGDKKKDKNKKDQDNDKSDKDKGISLFQLSSERISLEEENKK